MTDTPRREPSEVDLTPGPLLDPGRASDLLSSNAFERTVLILSSAGVRTGFTMDHPHRPGSQVLVTCSHRLVPDEPLKIAVRGNVVSPSLNRIEGIPDNVDIAAFRLSEPITPFLPLGFPTAPLALSEMLFVLGFPQGRTTQLPAVEYFAVVQRGPLAAWSVDDDGGRVHTLTIAVQTPKGSSGGPVIAVRKGGLTEVVGVISHRLKEWAPVYAGEVDSLGDLQPPQTMNRTIVGFAESPIGLAIAGASHYLEAALEADR